MVIRNAHLVGLFTISSFGLVGFARADDFPNKAPGTIISLGQPIGGTIEKAKDKDVVRFVTIADHDYSIQVSKSGAKGTIKLVLQGQDVLGGKMKTSGNPANLTYHAFVAGSCDLSVQFSGSSKGPYQIAITDLTVANDDWTPSHPGSVFAGPNPIAAYGTINYQGDHDPFDHLWIEKGKHYLVFTGSQPGSPAIDTFLKVDLGGGMILQDDNGGQSGLSQVEFEAPFTGSIAVDVSGVALAIGPYSLSALELVDDWTPMNPGTLVPGSIWQAAGVINFNGDDDIFTFNVEDGKYYVLVTGAAADGSTADTVLSVDLGAGSILTDDDAGPGKLSYLHFKSSISGTVFVHVRGHGAAKGGYRLAASIMGTDSPDDHGDEFFNSTELQLAGMPITATVMGGNDEKDVFHFEGLAGKTYVVTLDYGTVNYLQNITAVPYVSGPNGELIALPMATGSGSSATMSVSVPCQFNGSCYVVVQNKAPYAANLKINVK